jgi:hypothetical protein
MVCAVNHQDQSILTPLQWQACVRCVLHVSENSMRAVYDATLCVASHDHHLALPDDSPISTQTYRRVRDLMRAKFALAERVAELSAPEPQTFSA